MGTTKIEWTDYTFNTHWGCQRVSPGCEHCYAETFSARVGHGKRLPQIWGAHAERKFFGEEHWRQPIVWNAKAARDGVRRRVFCSSMADVFEGRADLDEVRIRLAHLVEATPHLDWLLLTKRPENMMPFGCAMWPTGWPTNVWAGTTVEDQRRADERIPELLKVPARVRFLSCEPLLENVDLTSVSLPADFGVGRWRLDATSGALFADNERSPFKWKPIDWVIVGGESGPGSRPFDFAWARSIRDQCADARVPCFVKQLGSKPYGEWLHGEPPISHIEDCTGRRWTEPARCKNGRWKLRDGKGGSMSEWPEDLRIREFPEVAA